MIAVAVLAVLALAPLPLPTNEKADYQLGGDYPPPAGVTVVTRDWFSGSPVGGDTYDICYVNAYQTQDNEDDVDRPDEQENWPADLVLSDLGDDPNWGGEYLVDISTSDNRRRAFEHVAPMIDACAERGFDAVEFDNLDSWTRFDQTPLADQVPFGRRAAVRYAEVLTDHAHATGLAVAQKNTPQLSRRVSLQMIGFDFAVAEECGFYRECDDYVAVFGDRVIVIEYTRRGFRRACRQFGDELSIMRRDVLLQPPSSPEYRYRAC